jgi:hypothetical protein
LAEQHSGCHQIADASVPLASPEAQDAIARSTHHDMLDRARTEQSNAQMAYEQMETRFRATRLASELRAAILLTFAKG